MLQVEVYSFRYIYLYIAKIIVYCIANKRGCTFLQYRSRLGTVFFYLKGEEK